MTQQPEIFVSAINGAKFDVHNALTASLLSKNEKKDIIHKAKSVNATVNKVTRSKKQNDNEQEIA